MFNIREIRYITFAEAARIAQVKPPAITALSKSNNPPSFIKIEGKKKHVDTQDPTWEAYKNSGRISDHPHSKKQNFNANERINEAKASLLELELSREVGDLISKKHATALTLDIIDQFHREISNAFWKMIPELKIFFTEGKEIAANAHYLAEIKYTSERIKKQMLKK